MKKIGFLLLTLLWLSAQTQFLNVEQYQLDNGFTVMLNQDSNATKVFGGVAVNTGSKNDPAKSTGLAHYLEHLLFKGTSELGTLNYEEEKPHIDSIFYYYDELAKYKVQSKRDSILKLINNHSLAASKYGLPNEFDNLLKSIGGSGINAFTSEELTFYHNSFPANQMERWLELYSHRFMNPVFRSFQSELEVVYEEKNRSMDNFQSQIFEILGKELFGEHPYGSQTTLGTVEHLKNPSLTRMYAYFKKWYVANNMALILTGNFDSEKIKPMIKQKFGKLPSAELPKMKVYEPKKFEGKEVVKARITPIKLGIIGYKTIANNHKDEPGLELCNYLLSNENETGLIDQLVLDGKILFTFSESLQYNEDGASLVLFGPKLLFQTFSKAEKLVFSAIERLKTGDFEEELLEIAKLQISKNYIQNIERTSSRGYLMGMIFNQNRDWEDYLKIPQKINQLTKTDVQNLAQKYFTGDMMLFKSRTGFPKKSKLDKPPVKGVVVDQKSSSEYAKNFKNIPYSKDEPRFLDFNKDVKTATVNSHVIHHVQNPINELYNLRMVIKTGTYENPLLAPAISMMSHAGTEAFSKNEFKKQMAKLGSTVYFDYDIGKITVNLSGLEKNVDKAIKLLNELLQNPVIDAKALKIVQDEFKSERKFILKDPSSMGQVLNSFVMYGDRSNYLRQNSLKEIKDITENEYLSTLKTFFSTNQFTIHYSGKKTIDQISNLFSNEFDLSKNPKINEPFYLKPNNVDKTNITLLDDKKAVQSQVYFHVNGNKYDIKQYAALNAFNAYFSGGFSGLILQEVREYRSLAYSAGGRYQTSGGLGERGELITYIGCQADKTVEAIEVMLSLINDMPYYKEREKMIKENLLNSMNTKYPSFRDKSKVIASRKEDGFKEDPNIKAFLAYNDLTFDDFAHFYESNIKGKPVSISIYGDANRINVELLKKLGPVKVVELDEVIKI